jgi:hypothetical protein
VNGAETFSTQRKVFSNEFSLVLVIHFLVLQTKELKDYELLIYWQANITVEEKTAFLLK